MVEMLQVGPILLRDACPHALATSLKTAPYVPAIFVSPGTIACPTKLEIRHFLRRVTQLLTLPNFLVFIYTLFLTGFYYLPNAVDQYKFYSFTVFLPGLLAIGPISSRLVADKTYNSGKFHWSIGTTTCIFESILKNYAIAC